MPISDKDHLDAIRAADIRRIDDLRASDQRAVELLAAANSLSATKAQLNISLLISIASVIVAIAAIIFHH